MPRQAHSILRMVDRVGELVQVGADRIEEAQHRGPLDIPDAALDARQVGPVEAGLSGYVSLCEPCAGAQFAESAAEGL